MRVVFTERAREQLDNRIQFSIEQSGDRVTERTFSRLDAYVHNTLARHPDTAGTRTPGRTFYEAWVPRTPFFVLYRLDETEQVVTVLAVYHHAQERSTFEPD